MINDTFHTYTHDAEGRLLTVDGGVSNGGETYNYNSRGLRNLTHQGVWEEVLYNVNGSQEATVLPGTNTLEWSEFYGYRHLGTFTAGGLNTTLFLLPDWLGTNRYWMTQGGAHYTSSATFPYGEILSAGIGDGWTGISGLWLDYADNTVHTDARQLSLNSGRWLTPDPAIMLGNRYAYVTNNPVSATDPSGLDEDDDGGGNGDIYTGSSPGMINPGNPTSFQLWSSLAMVGGGSLRNISASEEAAWLGSGSIPWYGVSYTGNSFNGMGGDLMLLVGSSYSWQDNPGWNPEDPNSSAGTGYQSALWADLGPVATTNSYQMSTTLPQVSLPGPVPTKHFSAFANYAGFLGCELNSALATVTDQEYEGNATAFGFINAGALAAIRFRQANVIGITFVATAGAMDIGVMAKANRECTPLFYP